MTTKNYTRSTLAVLAIGALALTGANAARAQDKPNVRLLSGPTGGSYYILGAILADALYHSGLVASATSEASSGGLENGRRVGTGDAPFGMMDVAWVRRAAQGDKPFKRKLRMLTATPLFVSPMFFVTPADSAIKTFDDMRGMRVAVGARHSGMENHARHVLAAFGWTFSDIKPVFQGFSGGGKAMRAGRVDAQLQCCIPNGGLTELSTLSHVRIVGWKPGELDKVVNSSPDYGKTTIKKGAFRGVDKNTPSIALFNGIMTNAKTKDEVVYILVKTMLANLKEMSKKSALFGTLDDVFERAKAEGSKALEVGAPLHPGAIRAFKEAGILK